VAERFAGGDAELLPDQVDPGRLLGHRVLDLQPRVDFEEAHRAVGTDEVLDGAGAVVAGLAADRLGALVDPGALLVGEERGGGLLDQLLVAALQRAVAGTGDDHVAVVVGEHLCLDVPGPVEVPLDEALAPPERGHRFAGRGLEQVRNLLHRPGHLEAAPAAAEGGLDGDRQPVLLGERDDLLGVRDRLGGTGDERRAGPLGDVPGGHLVAEVADRLRGRADPGQPGLLHRLGEVGVLREKPVPRVYRVRTRPGRHVDELVDAQVRLGGRVATQRVRLVGEHGVRRVPVGVRVHGHGGEPRVPARPDHPDRDLAPVRHQYLSHAGECKPAGNHPRCVAHRFARSGAWSSLVAALLVSQHLGWISKAALVSPDHAARSAPCHSSRHTLAACPTLGCSSSGWSAGSSRSTATTSGGSCSAGMPTSGPTCSPARSTTR
jgi:hypothetical protein